MSATVISERHGGLSRPLHGHERREPSAPFAQGGLVGRPWYGEEERLGHGSPLLEDRGGVAVGLGLTRQPAPARERGPSFEQLGRGQQQVPVARLERGRRDHLVEFRPRGEEGALLIRTAHPSTLRLDIVQHGNARLENGLRVLACGERAGLVRNRHQVQFALVARRERPELRCLAGEQPLDGGIGDCRCLLVAPERQQRVRALEQRSRRVHTRVQVVRQREQAIRLVELERARTLVARHAQRVEGVVQFGQGGRGGDRSAPAATCRECRRSRHPHREALERVLSGEVGLPAQFLREGAEPTERSLGARAARGVARLSPVGPGAHHLRPVARHFAEPREQLGAAQCGGRRDDPLLECRIE